MRMALGTMSGTSIDGLDLALVRIEGVGLAMRAAFVRGWSASTRDFAERTRALATGVPATAAEIAALALDLAAVHVEAIGAARAEAGPFDLVAVHGQTVFHRPPVSWQLVNPWPIARAAACPVVFDLRGADLAAGGQGAPITPIADWVLFRDATRSRAIVNLGGFCNITALPAGDAEAIARIAGRDVCVCNQLLDALARGVLDVPYDDGGIAALSGAPNAEATSALRAALASQRGAGRSLGTGDEAFAWIDAWRTRVSPLDLAASAASAIGAEIGAAAAGADEIVLAGGGTRHAALVRAIGASAGVRPRTTDALGVPSAYREAAAMAVLGALCQDRVPITLCQATGVPAPAPIAGAWIHPS
jgi:1,6-anhydro-N-acetylmuramate kinase